MRKGVKSRTISAIRRESATKTTTTARAKSCDALAPLFGRCERITIASIAGIRTTKAIPFLRKFGSGSQLGGQARDLGGGLRGDWVHQEIPTAIRTGDGRKEYGESLQGGWYSSLYTGVPKGDGALD